MPLSVMNRLYPDRMMQLSDPDTVSAINAVWIIVAGIFCFQLQIGFGLLEVGSVRAKNAQNIMLYVRSYIGVYFVCGDVFEIVLRTLVSDVVLRVMRRLCCF
jgi:hypothetical protein